MDIDSIPNGAVPLCVLFADIVGSTRLYELLGDQEASRVVKLCLDEMKTATQINKGWVVETVGDEILSTFASPEQGALAAEVMMRRVERLPPVAEKPVSLRIGFHYGPVLRENDKIFGDTVNTAARIVSLARARQIFASKSTVELMPPFMRGATRDLAAFSLKGKREEMEVCEILWQGDCSQLTVQFKSNADLAQAKHRLVLSLGAEQRHVVDADSGPVSLGRDPENQVVIDNLRISRRHAKIDLRRGKFVLADSSTNGTWVLFDGKSEALLRHEEIALYGRGLITLGRPYDRADPSGTLGFTVG
ncbi:MAG: adenylate/guanylate cyclase domain-containing protein [Candidatus Methylumidiphilus sp.]